MRKSLIAAVLAFSCLSITAEARPSEGTLVTSSLEVFYGDLNLANRAGAAAMLNRIKQAAVRVCGGTPSTQDMSARREFRACIERATADAVRQLNAPLVTAMHGGRSSADPQIAGR
jgi:UrcA family protein